MTAISKEMSFEVSQSIEFVHVTSYLYHGPASKNETILSRFEKFKAVNLLRSYYEDYYI